MNRNDTPDLMAIGGCRVEFRGRQIGGGLSGAQSFDRAIGGDAAGIALGLARLGLRVALLARVGDDPLGSFAVKTLSDAGIDVAGVQPGPAGTTALACGACDDSRSDHLEIFLQASAPGLAIPPPSGRPPALLVAASAFAAAVPVVAEARAEGSRIVIRLCGDAVPDIRILESADLILDAGESELPALRAASPRATIVCGLGAQGCRAFDASGASFAAPRRFAVEISNPFDGRDAAAAGFLSGWLRGEPLETCCIWADAGAALALSSAPGTQGFPVAAERDAFLARATPPHQPRYDAPLRHLRWTTLRRPGPASIVAFACDHRMQLEQIADAAGAPHERIAAFKMLTVRAVEKVAGGRPGFGMFLDGRYGRAALAAAARAGLWTARPIERTGSRPLEFEGGADGTADTSLAAHIAEWPAGQVAKCLCFYHPADDAALKARQLRELLRAQAACRHFGRELLVEIIAGKNGPIADGTVGEVLRTLYAQGLRPDWWKLEPQTSPAAWEAIGAAIVDNDPQCLGVLVLGLNAPIAQLEEAFAAARTPWVRGFAIGRSIFADPARDWLGGTIDDAAAIALMAERFAGLVKSWQRTHPVS